VKYLAVTFNSTEASERSGRLGDNALFCLIAYLKKEYGIQITETAVAFDHKKNPITIQERLKVLFKSKNVNSTLIFGDDTYRAVKNWFTGDNVIKLPSAYYFVRSPEKIPLQLLPLMNMKETNTVKGLNNDKTIG